MLDHVSMTVSGIPAAERFDVSPRIRSQAGNGLLRKREPFKP